MRIVRELVCKGIAHGLFSQESIRQMRQWFFDTKVASRFVVDTSDEDIAWLEALRSNHVRGVPFQPWHGQLPEYDWKTAAALHFSGQYRPLLSLARSVPITESTRCKALRLAKKWRGKELFDVTTLEKEYQQCVSLCAFMGRNLAGLGYNARQDARLHYDEVEPSLLAFCALLLFVSGWQFEAAAAKLAHLVNADAPMDLTLGNIIGLNPFHDYLGWRVVMLAGQLGRDRPARLGYAAVLAQIEARLRDAHRDWVTTQVK